VEPEKVFFFKLWRTSIFIFKKKVGNSLLEKLVLLLSVQYAIPCHAITVTKYHFVWYSVVINVSFNTVKLLPIVSERTAENKR
jgi:hypothetical protein